MGTNFYLRRKEPTLHECVHVCKCSYGWRTTWQATDERDWPRWCDIVPGPELESPISSVEDVRGYLETGEWELVDEYGDVHDDWDDVMSSLEVWDGGVGMDGRRPLEHDVECGEGYRDVRGNIFVREGFC